MSNGWKDGIDRTPYKYGPRDIVEPDEVREMMEKMDRTRDRCLLALHYLSGARVSEIIELERQDIVIDDERLTVRFSRRKKKNSQGPLRKRSFIVFPRDAPFAGNIIKYLERFGFSSGDFIFPSPAGGHLSRQRVWQILNEVNEDVSSHFFRHTRLSRLWREGYGLEALRQFAGRDTPPVEYIEPDEDLMRRMGEDLE